MVVIVLNVIEMCVWWYGQTGSIVKFKENLNLAFSIIFMVCTHSPSLYLRFSDACPNSASSVGYIHRVFLNM